MKKIVVIILFIISINLFDSFRQFTIGWFTNANTFYYTNVNKELILEETTGFLKLGGWTFEDLLKVHIKWHKCRPTLKNKTLYRTFELKPWQFWFWLNYFTHPRWDLPYLDKTEPFPNTLTPSICPEPVSLE